MKKIIIISILMLFQLIVLVNATGLTLNITGFEVNKTENNNVNLDLIITNTETVPFHNISFEENEYITVPTYSKIDPGQTVTLTAIVDGTSNFNGDLRLKGFYYTDIGEQNQTHEVIVNSYYSTPCTFSIVKGDSIKWTSNVLNTINLKTYPDDVPVDGVEMSKNQSRTRKFNTVEDYKYRWYVGSWGFDEVCTVSVLDSTGYINDPQLDAVLNLRLNIEYEKTSVSSNIINKDFSLDFFSTDEGIMSITNTGDKIAKNVNLSCDWLEFSENNFDLEAGSTNSLSFTVKPKGISTTNQTNQTYHKDLLITGNFDTINETLNIFIKHADIGNGSANATNFLDWLCTQRPDLCSPNIEYVYITNDSEESFVPITREQWRDYNLDLINEKEEREILDNYIKSSLDSYNQSFSQMALDINELKTEVNDMKSTTTSSQTGVIAFLVILLLVSCSIVVYLLIRTYNQKNKKESFERIDFKSRR